MTPADTTPLGDLEIAVCHGNYLARGGGERVAEAIARTFDAPLYYGFGDPSHVPDDIDAESVCNDSRLSRFDESKLVRDSYYWWHFDHLPELHDYDVVIQSGNEFGWYVPPDSQVVVRYLHSTPRTPYDRYPDKGDQFKERVYSKAARKLYRDTVAYPDAWVPNSEVIERRLNRYFDKSGDDVQVVHPPVETHNYPVGMEEDRDDDLYVTWSRLYPSKGIELIVDTFREHPEKRLVIGGTGPEKDRLEPTAPDNVEFRGWLTEDEKRSLVQQASATIFAARNEDFGLVPVESMAAGCPVIGVRDGYTQHQIADGQNGHLFDRDVESLSAAIARHARDGVSASSESIAAHADQYSVPRFQSAMRRVVADAVERVRVDVTQEIQTAATDPAEATLEVRPDGGEE